MASTRWRKAGGFAPLILAASAAAAAEEAVEVVSPPVEVRREAIPATPLAGARLVRRLDAAVPGVTWSNVPLRHVLRQVSDGYAVAVLCDRRIDPTAAPEVTAANVPLRDVLRGIAAEAGGELRVVGNVAYVGPAEAARVVRTLAELRRQELASGGPRLAGRRAELLNVKTVAWGDLTEPTEVLRLVAGRYGLAVENPDLLPHDLWAGATLPEISAPEMLTLLLVQYDLTFAWGDDLRSVRLVPLPGDLSRIAVERPYPFQGRPDETIAALRDRFGEFDAEVADRQIVVRGPLELHEALGEVLAGRPQARSRPATGDAAPLSRRRFTLAVSRVPARAVMEKLEQS
ncbi:MAG TPA: hypothetical protein VF170_08135, partial [Planctomycetaceae bacterium]